MFRWGKGLGYLVVVDASSTGLAVIARERLPDGHAVPTFVYHRLLVEVGTLRFEQTERLPSGDGAVAGLRAYACAPRDR